LEKRVISPDLAIFNISVPLTQNWTGKNDDDDEALQKRLLEIIRGQITD
jgi:hypothetical protein